MTTSCFFPGIPGQKRSTWRVTTGDYGISRELRARTGPRRRSAHDPHRGPTGLSYTRRPVYGRRVSTMGCGTPLSVVRSAQFSIDLAYSKVSIDPYS